MAARDPEDAARPRASRLLSRPEGGWERLEGWSRGMTLTSAVGSVLSSLRVAAGRMWLLMSMSASMPAKAIKPVVLFCREFRETEEADANGEERESSTSRRAAEPPPPLRPARGTASLCLDGEPRLVPVSAGSPPVAAPATAEGPMEAEEAATADAGRDGAVGQFAVRALPRS